MATIVVYESHDHDGDMLFSVTLTAATYSRPLVDELRRLAGPDAKYVYVPDGGRVNGGPLDREEVAYIEHGAVQQNLGDVLVDLMMKRMQEAGQEPPYDAWRELFPAGYDPS